MPNHFPVIEVPEEVADAPEQMGTKFKFWFYRPSGKCLFKQPTPGTGEDWAEKVAAELCGMLGLPHADYELAKWSGKRGVISPSFLPENAFFLAGNEIMLRIVKDYPTQTPNAFYKVTQHTLAAVVKIIKLVELPFNWTPLPGISTALETFLGYLLLDAWIGNTDRHHENWGLVGLQSGENKTSIHLAPTFDHASSMGRNESDEKRSQRILAKDHQFTVRTYAEKTKSAFYHKPGDSQPMRTFDAFCALADDEPKAAALWLNALKRIRLEEVELLFSKIPSDLISTTATEFALKMLECNRVRLLSLLKE